MPVYAVGGVANFQVGLSTAIKGKENAQMYVRDTREPMRSVLARYRHVRAPWLALYQMAHFMCTCGHIEASSTAYFHPKVKAVLRQESVNSEEDLEGLRCNMGQGQVYWCILL